MTTTARFPRLPSLAVLTSVSRKGFDLKSVSKPDEAQSFICHICKLLARYPIELKQCGHLFCKECLDDYSTKPTDLSSGKVKCPQEDGTDFTVLDRMALEESSKCAYGLYAEIDIKCANGCGAVLSADSMTEHENWVCPKRMVECAHIGCNQRMPHNEIGPHIETCDHRLIYCAICALPRKFLGRHTCIKEMRKTMDRMPK